MNTTREKTTLSLNSTGLQAYLELGMAMVIVGSMVVVSKIITNGFPIFLAAAIRFTISTAIMLPMLLRSEGYFPVFHKKEIGLLFLQAFAGNFLFSIFLLYGLKMTGAGESGIILGAVPAVIGLLSFLFFREQLGARKILALVIATGGVVTLSLGGAAISGDVSPQHLAGNLLVLGAVIGEALWTILGKVVSRKVKPLAISTMTSLFGLVLFLPLGLIQLGSVHWNEISWQSWAAVVYYGLGTVGAYTLWYRGVTKSPASTAGVFTGIQPVAALIFSFLVLGEPIRGVDWMGIAGILAAIGLLARPSSRKEVIVETQGLFD